MQKQYFRPYFTYLLMLLLCLASNSAYAFMIKNTYVGTFYANDPDKYCQYCVPADVYIKITFEISNYNNEPIDVFVDWSDGSSDTLYLGEGAGRDKLSAEPDNKFSYELDHRYNKPNSGKCYYDVKITPRVEGTVGTSTTKQFYVWDMDDPGGQLKVNPQVINLCAGTKEAYPNFQDKSIWNCVPTVDVPSIEGQNDSLRHTQWVYGTSGTSTGLKSKIEIRQKQGKKGDAWTGVTQEGEIAPNLKDGKPSIEPAGDNVKSNFIYFKEALVEDTFKIFEVTLQNWNACNPYKDMSGKLWDKDPVKMTGKVRIVPVPQPVIILDSVCANKDYINLSKYIHRYVDTATIRGLSYLEWGGNNITKGHYLQLKNENVKAGDVLDIYLKAGYDSTACLGTGYASIVVVDGPVYEDEVDTTSFCTGEEIVLNPGHPGLISGNDNTGFDFDYDWRGSDDNLLNDKDISAPTLDAPEMGLYNVRADVYIHYSKDVECFASKEYFVYVDDLDASFSEDTIYLCAGETVDLIPFISNKNNAELAYNWTSTNREAIDYLSDVSQKTAIFTAKDKGTFKYIFSATNIAEGGCTAIDDITIIVDKPDATIETADQAVSGRRITLQGASTNLSKRWRIESKPDNGGVRKFDGDATDEVIVEVTKEGEYSFSYTVTNNETGCESTELVTIGFIDPLVTYDKSYATCGTSFDNLVARVADNAEAGGQWAEDSSNPAKARFGDINNNITTVEVDKPGEYIFYWIDVNRDYDGNIFNKDTAEIKVTFINLPEVNFIPDNRQGCTPLKVKFNNKTNGDGFSYEWKFGDNATSVQENPVHVYKNKTQSDKEFQVKLTASREADGQLCSSTKSVKISVKPNADAILDGSSSAACSPVSVEFENKSQNAVKYYWHVEYDDDDIDNYSTTKKTVVGGVFRNESANGEVKDRPVRLVAEHSNGCTDTITQHVIVAPSRPITFSMDKRRICNGEEVIFDAEMGAMTYNWDFGDNTTLEGNSRLHFAKTFTNPSEDDINYIVSLKATTAVGCDTTYSDTILVRGNIRADFTVTPTEGVKSLTAEIEDLSVNADSVRWVWGDRNADSLAFNFSEEARLIKHFYNNESFWPATYYLNQYAYRYYDFNLLGDTLESCIDHKVEEINLIPEFKVDFTTDTFYCSPAVARFDNISTGASKFVWDFGDGSPKEKTFYPVHEYNYDNPTGEPITYTVKLIGQSSWRDEETGEFLKDSAEKQVTIYPTIDIRYDVHLNEDGDYLNLQNMSYGAQLYRWIVDEDTVYSSTPDDYKFYIGDNVKFKIGFNARLEGFSGNRCYQVDERNIKHAPDVHADFEGDTTGCSMLTALLRSTSTGELGYKWIIEDKVIQGKTKFFHHFVNHSYTEVDTVDVTLIALGVDENDTITKQVIVKPLPTVSFDIDKDFIISEDSVKIDNTSEFADEYNWIVGSNTADIYFKSRYFTLINNTSEPVAKKVSLHAVHYNGCDTTIEDSVIVYPKVSAEIICDNKEDCSPLTANLTANCINAHYFEWNVDGKIYSNKEELKDLVFVNDTDKPKKIYVELMASSFYGIKAYAYDTLIVNPSVELDYSYTSMGKSPFNFSINNRSKNADSYKWSFGGFDTTTYVTNNTIRYHYTNNTTTKEDHIVSLFADNQYGCSASDELRVAVYPQLKADFDVVVERCTNDSVLFINKSINAGKCFWSFGNGQTSTITDSAFIYQYTDKIATDKTFTARLIVVSDNDLFTDTLEKDIKIYATPDAVMKLAQDGNNPKSIVATAEVTGADYWEWDLGLGDDDRHLNQESVSHIYDYPDITERKEFQINLTAVSNSSECPDTAKNKVYVYPFVEAKIVCNDVSGCTPLIVEFGNESEGAETYSWNFGDGSVPGIVKYPTKVFENNSHSKDTTYEVVLAARSAHGITDKDTIYITVHPKPYADFEFVSDPVCSSESAVILNHSNYYSAATWNFSNEYIEEQTVIVDTLEYIFINNTPEIQRETVLLTLENNNCDTTIKRYVKVNPSVEANFSSIDAVCSGTAVDFFNTSLNASEYLWNFADSTHIDTRREPSFIFTNKSSQDSLFNVVLSAYSADENACFDTDTHRIVVYPEPDYNLEANPTKVQLPDAWVTANSNLQNFKDWRLYWDFGDGSYQSGETTARYEYNDNEDYVYPLRLDLTDTITGCFYSDSVYITVESADVVADFNCDTLSGCAPLTVEFTNISPVYEIAEWNFDDGTGYQTIGDTTFTHKYGYEGTYHATLIVYDKYRYKTDTLSKTITVFEPVTAIMDLDREKITSFFQELELSAEHTINADLFRWSYADTVSDKAIDTVQFHQETESAMITLLATNSESGCYDMDTIYIPVSNNYNFRIPNAFIPSESGASGGSTKNYSKGDVDIFYPFIYDKNVKTYLLQIFNRWGQLLFESKDLEIGWDGYYNDEMAPQDVYVYRIKIVYKDGSEVVKAGDVTLLR